MNEVEKEMTELRTRVSDSDYVISLGEMFSILWHKKLTITAFVSLVAIGTIIVTLLMPNIYRSHVRLAPSEESSKGLASKLGGELGGFAQLAGVSIGDGAVTPVTYAMEVMRSREFVGNFIEKHDVLVPLFAGKGWDWNKKELVLDGDVYDAEKKEWVREADFPKTPKPSRQEAYEEFMEILSVNQDKKTSMVDVTVDFISPVHAQKWASLMVAEINQLLKARDVGEAERSISYLEEKLAETRNPEVRMALSQLIEQNMKAEVLANVRDEYFFETVDPAIAAEKKIKPRRGTIVGLSVIGSFVFICMMVLVLALSRERR